MGNFNLLQKCAQHMVNGLQSIGPASKLLVQGLLARRKSTCNQSACKPSIGALENLPMGINMHLICFDLVPHTRQQHLDLRGRPPAKTRKQRQ